MICPDNVTNQVLERILTQYRESPNLIRLIRHDVDFVQGLINAICAIPDLFDIDTAVGDQLTIIGKWLGFPRTHCVCVDPMVYGFPCGDPVIDARLVTDFCEPATWDDCRQTGTTTITIGDDDVYRAILKARARQNMQLYHMGSLTEAVQGIWGTSASVEVLKVFEVVICPGRALSTFERDILPIAFRALPIAHGIVPKVSYHEGKAFGFGDGWGGLCENAGWICPENPHIYSCA
jgi:hypothetical protein